MKKILLAIILLAGINGFSQTKETLNYSGEYDDGTPEKGTATYSYYENFETKEKVIHGSFKFTKKIDGFNMTISGQFEDGKRQGEWTYNADFVDYKVKGKYHLTGSASMTSYYENGLPVKTWTFKQTGKGRNKNVTWDGIVTWEEYDKEETFTASMSFSNGNVFGKFEFIDGFTKEEMHGEVNANQQYIGEYYYKDVTQREIIRTHTSNGVVTSGVVKDKGKVTYDMSGDAQLVQLSEKYAADTSITSEIESKGYYVAYYNTFGEYNDDLTALVRSSFYSGLFIPSYIPGDLMFQRNQPAHKGPTFEMIMKDDGY